MKVTFQGKPVTLEGNELREGMNFPDFDLTDQSLKIIKSNQIKGIRVFAAVPSLDTGVCDMEIKKFNERASEIPGVSVYAVSLDLPFAQARWCGANGVSKVTVLSDYRDRSFGTATGTFIKELALLTRAVFVVDSENRIAYAEYVPEITDHPDYDRIYAKLKEITG